MQSGSLARLQIVAAALLFSTGGAAIKACSLTPWEIAGLRSGVAGLALVLLVPAARRGWSWPKAGVGLAYATTLILFVAATKWTTAANAIFLQYTSPLYVLVLGPWLLREPIRRQDWAFIVCIAGGMALFFAGEGVATETAPEPARGDLAGALSGIAMAAMLIGLRWLRTDGTTAVAMGNAIAFVAALPLMLPLSGLSGTNVLLLLYLGVFQIALPYALLTRATSHVTALELALLLVLEPVINPLWAWIFQGEAPGGLSLAGGLCILGATTARAWLAHDLPAKGTEVP